MTVRLLAGHVEAVGPTFHVSGSFAIGGEATAMVIEHDECGSSGQILYYEADGTRLTIGMPVGREIYGHWVLERVP